MKTTKTKKIRKLRKLKGGTKRDRANGVSNENNKESNQKDKITKVNSIPTGEFEVPSKVNSIPTGEFEVPSTVELDSYFRKACYPHPTYPSDSFLDLLESFLKKNGRTQIIKGWVNKPEGKSETMLKEENDYSKIDKELLTSKISIFSDKVEEIVKIVEEKYSIPINKYSFDLQVRHADNEKGLKDIHETYHIDKWGIWCPWTPKTSRLLMGYNRDVNPRYVICVYMQNFFPESALLKVGDNDGNDKYRLGNVQYISDTNWPFKIATIDQKEYKHAPYSYDNYAKSVFMAHGGDKWRVLLRIHVSDEELLSGGCLHKGGTIIKKIVIPNKPSNENENENETQWLV